MLTLVATAALPAGAHPVRYRTPGTWRIALAALGDDGYLRLDRAALGTRLYTGLVFRAEVDDAPTGAVTVPAGGRSAGVLRLADDASVLPSVTWTADGAATGIDPRIEWLLPGRAGQTWPAGVTVRLYLDEPDGAPGAPIAPASGAGYAAPADMVARYGADEIADLLGIDRAATGPEFDTARMGRALADADAEIDAGIGALYPLPLDATCPLLRGIACDVARRHLYDEDPPEAVRNAASSARSRLKQLGTGALSLVADDGALVARRAHTSVAEQAGRAPVFTADALAGL